MPIDPQLLTQLLTQNQTQAPDPLQLAMAASSPQRAPFPGSMTPVPQPMSPMGGGPSMPQNVPMMPQPQQPPIQAPPPRDNPTKQMLKQAAATFLFSLGQGLSAAGANPQNARPAALGAAIQGGNTLDAINQERNRVMADQAMKARGLDIEKTRADASLLSEQRQAAAQEDRAKQVPIIDADGVPMTDTLGQPMMADAATAARVHAQLKTSQQRIQSNESLADAKLRWEKDKATILNPVLANNGQKYDEKTGTVVNMTEDELPLPVKAKMQRSAVLNDLADATKELAIARKNNEPLRMAIAQANAMTAQKRLELSDQRFDLSSVKTFDPALDADTRLALMTDAAGPSYQGKGGQADLALLFNHIGMTLSAQKGARVTNAEIERAITARSLPEAIQAQYDKVTSGKFLSQAERRDMVQNALISRQKIWDRVRREGRAGGLSAEPEPDPSLPKLDVSQIPQLNTKPTTAPAAPGNPFRKPK